MNLDLENVVDSQSKLLKKVSSHAVLKPTPKRDLQRKMLPLNVVNAQSKTFTLCSSSMAPRDAAKSTKNADIMLGKPDPSLI